MRETWELPGGVQPPENKHQSLQAGIGALPLPEKLVIPLNQHLGAPAKPIVAVGERVLKGQTLAAANGFVSAAAHAPTSGIIEAIGEQTVPHPSGMSSLCITLAADGRDEWMEYQGVADYTCVAPTDLLDIIRRAGIVGMGGAGFPSSVKLQPRSPIDTLIINATECEPYITADDILMQERPEEIVEGIKILSHILGNPETVLIGIEDNKPKAYEALEPLLEGTNIELVDFHARYPSGGEKQLIYILTGKEVPSGGLPADIGIVCQNIGTTHAIYRAVCQGIPLISRITTVTGKALDTNRNYEVLLGTPVSHLLQHNGYQQGTGGRLVMGGPMMGFSLPDPDVPAIKTTNCILASTREELPAPPPAQPCIRCGMCAEVCPASLLPQQLFWYAQSQNHERLEAHSLFDCIECGACSYVCPSNIPLVQYYRAAKGEIRQAQVEHAKSDKARQRFEFQQTRKEKAEAAKAAKREARREAAKAKASQTGGDSGDSVDSLIKAAQARVAERQSKPEDQLARQQRAVASAAERVVRAAQHLAELQADGSEEQVAQAKLEDTRHRLKEASNKLAELQAAVPQNSASGKLSASPGELLEQKIAGIEKRIATMEAKLADMTEDTTAESLRKGLAKQQARLAEARRQLSETPEQPAVTTPEADEAQDAAGQAIAKAQAKAAALANMSEAEKLEQAIASLKTRLEKARQRLAAAEQEGGDHIDALRTAAEKLQAKLAEAEAKLEKSS